MSAPVRYRAWDKKSKEYRIVEKIIFDHNGNIDFVVTVDKNTGHDPYDQTLDEIVLEQDTGFKDKHGKKIFEGDILETCCGKAEVYFDDELLMYKIKIRHGGTMSLVSKKSKRHFDYEIIDNIHENPELFGGKNE